MYYSRVFEVRIKTKNKEDLWDERDLLTAIASSDELAGVEDLTVKDTKRED